MGIFYTLKNNQVIRNLLKPYVDYKRRIEHKAYLKTSDSKYLKTIRNLKNGDRCFIIGNGPSLEVADLKKIMKEYTFAANRIYEIFDKTVWRPTYYLAVDDDFILENIDKLKNIDSERLFLALDSKYKLDLPKNNVTRIFELTDFKVNKWNDTTSHISTDISNYFSVGYTVVFTAIQLAIYMGFKEIYLLGVDFNYSVIRDKNGKIHEDKSVKDYFSGEKYNSTVLNYNSTLYAYAKAKEYADANGIKIINCTRGGKLEVFERRPLEQVLL